MTVLVIGAGGHVGHLIVSQLKDQGQDVVAAPHKEADAKRFKTQGTKAVSFDLLKSVQELAKKMSGIDTVVFSAGAGGTGVDKTILVDLDGAVKSMQAAQSAGIKRYIMVSAIGADHRNQWMKSLLPYYVAKFYANVWLKHTDLNYTILEPGLLTFDKPTGNIQTQPSQKGGKISRGDVAATVVASLKTPQTIGKTITLVSGNQPIEKALTQT